MPARMTKKQWRFLNSKGSPLTTKQKKKIRRERRKGKIKFKKSKRRKRR